MIGDESNCDLHANDGPLRSNVDLSTDIFNLFTYQTHAHPQEPWYGVP